MRTHLMHTVPAVTPEATCDHGDAANDECFLRSPAAPLMTIATGCRLFDDVDASETNHDDYYLGGYAGI